jgi:mono/diheme cytochrome c family protein
MNHAFLAPASRSRLFLFWMALAGLLGAGAACAQGTQPLTPTARYQQECAACHIAYPPGMLPPASWKRVMGSLDKHYGTDASLDEASVREISAWLQTNAGTGKRAAEEPPQDRITRSQWFVRQHHEVNPQIWKQAAVKSAANCAACHTGADKGRFRESEIQFPKGLDARFRRGWSD